MSVAMVVILFTIVSTSAESVNGQTDQDYGLPVGSKAPVFKTKTYDNKVFNLKNTYKNAVVVLVFYRGGWCPFCSTQLRELQQNLKEFKARGATLAALSVDTVENSAATQKKNDLGFSILSDPKANILGLYNLKLELDNETLKKYKEYGINIEKASGEKHHQIAVPAVFIIDKKGVIRWSYVNLDYKTRAKVSDILEQIDKLK